ncbi:hypothetical protein CLV59_10134 [Chitinophaga dinghuensis]|uniref:DUF5689 domain-containing protein n=1 Tax=Chitinophaga dinghuensis TaxID=1539050 RepID=A0A327W9K6_9BACT|nr:DUF5689 domain-containing protein [Chitinophaga dinghuensis]RAJ87285.1 hypothetical protein CLV59_10134 [Chitinophaga dinghuensis]
MNNKNLYITMLLSLVLLWGCAKDDTYPGGVVSDIIGIMDIRSLYKDKDVTLTRDILGGSAKIAGIVVSDHSGGNLPKGLLIIQDTRRLAKLRGISIALGDDATKFAPGDSVLIKVEGSTLKRVDGILQITGVPTSNVTKISSGNSVLANKITTSAVAANPDNYESTMAIIVKGGFDPTPPANATLAGDRIMTDGFGEITLHTDAKAAFANIQVPVLANFYGIILCTPSGDTLLPRLSMRTGSDYTLLSSTITVAPLVISGFVNDPAGPDANFEYVQLLATQDIDFSVTPYCIIANNNANASTPTGNPVNGWATGGMRSYKINITSGVVKKGTYCYVGGTKKNINGENSTDISAANWVRNFDYAANNGEDFGTKTTNWMANSGNAFGIAIFAGTKVTATTVPTDVIFMSGGGSIYAAPSSGYLITNNDFYDIKDPISLKSQPYYKAGTNTLCLAYVTGDAGYYIKLGGVYSPSLGRWMKARAQNNLLMTKQTTLAEIESDDATKLK